MARIDKVLNNVMVPGECLVARVDNNNILSVISVEQTAVVTKPENLDKEKSIVIVCEDLVIAVATIKSVSEYDSNKYSNVWKSTNNAWRSVIEFEDVILLGDSIENIFGKGNTIKNVQTVMNLRDQQEVTSLRDAINTLYLLNIKSYLSNLGIQ